jgi:zinc protease
MFAKTLGALPERVAVKPAFAERRKLKFPVGQRSKKIEFESDLSRAMLCVAWETSAERSLTNDRRLNVLASVLNDRLRVKVRKEFGATYTPEVVNATSDGFTDFGYLAAVMLLEEQRIGEIGKLVTEIAADMASGKISDDEFERAMKPVTASLDDLDNGYWLKVVGQCQARPEFLAAARNRKSDYMSITKDELAKLATTLLSADKPLVISVVPKKEKDVKPVDRSADASTEK